MTSLQTSKSQKSVVDQLQRAYKLADEILKSRKLHLRTKNLNSIESLKARQKEKWRQNFSKYDGEQFDAIVKRALSNLKNNKELLYIFEYIDLQNQSITSANVLEFRMLKIQEIINLLEKYPEKYISESVILNGNVVYKNSTGEITQYANSLGVKNDAKQLIGYLWGKRKIIYLDKSPTKEGRPVSKNSVLNNTGISSRERLKDVIDNFNAAASTNNISAKIKRDRSKSTLQLEIIDEFSARF